MAVAYDNLASIGADGVTTLTTGSFTISGANRVATVGLSAFAIASACTGFSGSVGGVALSQITGTDTGLQTDMQTNLLGAIAPATGSQTGSLSWTGACTADIAVTTYTGADQTTPFTNGTFAHGTSTTSSVTISSAAGNMTQDVMGDRANDVPSAPTKTSRLASNDFSTIAVSTAAGAASNTHAWTITSSNWVASGVNIAQVSGSDVTVGMSGSASTSGSGTGVPNFQIAL